MGLLDRLFGRKKQSSAGEVEMGPCPHTQLVPRWAEAADMGHEDKASEYVCSSCGERFSPERAREIRTSGGSDLKEKLG